MKKFPAGHPHAVTPERLARWEAASTHPDENDFKKAEEFFSDLLNKWTTLLKINLPLIILRGRFFVW